MTRSKKVVIIKNQFLHARQPHERIFVIYSYRCLIFSIVCLSHKFWHDLPKNHWVGWNCDDPNASTRYNLKVFKKKRIGKITHGLKLKCFFYPNHCESLCKAPVLNRWKVLLYNIHIQMCFFGTFLSVEQQIIPKKFHKLNPFEGKAN